MSTTKSSPASEAWVLLSKLFQANKGRFFAIAGEFELSPPQVIALRLLDEHEPRAMSALATEMHCDNSNITGIVDRLESRGLVERRAAQHDRRVKHLILTESGAQVRARLDQAMSQAPEQLERLSATDQRQLRDLLRKALD
jgi:DNA-binding MarR family transcriptional regulator